MQTFTVEEAARRWLSAPKLDPETERAAAEATIAFLTDKVKSEKISTVFYIEFSNHQVAACRKSGISHISIPNTSIFF